MKKKPIRYSFLVIHFCEQEPNPNSRIYLDTNELDNLGMPKVILDWKISEMTRNTLYNLKDYLIKHLKENNLGEYIEFKPSWNEFSLARTAADQSDDLPFTDASHHIGTTRMASIPNQGVVDKNCKVFGIQNLYMAGSSIFPTSGYANPLLTATALGLRLGKYLIKKRSL